MGMWRGMWGYWDGRLDTPRLRHRVPGVAGIVGVALALLALAPLLAACDSPSTPRPTRLPDGKQILRIALPGEANLPGLDPVTQTDPNALAVIQLIFPGLVTLDGAEQVKPWAAERVEVSSDGTRYTFHLHSGMTFSDGEPIDARAFAYAINRALDPCVNALLFYYLAPIKDAVAFHGETCVAPGSYSAGLGQTTAPRDSLIGDSLLVEDAQTLAITLERPTPSFLAALAFPTSYAVPQKLIEQNRDGWTRHLTDGGGFGGNLFKLTKWDASGALTLIRNDAFWGTKPALREVDVTLVASPDAAYSAFTKRQSDIGFAPVAQYGQVHTRADFHQAGEMVIDYYGLNWKVAPFDDLRMRQAFALALDKQTLARKLPGAIVAPTNHLVPEGTPGYNPALTGPDGAQRLTGAPDKAKALAQAYADERCGGALATCPPVTLTISGATPAPEQEAKLALQMWQAALPGYPIKLAKLSNSALLDALDARSLQMWAINWSADYPDPQDWLSLQFLPGAPYNDGSVTVAEANTLMARADIETDATQRLKDYQSAEQALVNAVGWIPLDQPQFWWQAPSYVQGFTLDTRQVTPLPNWQAIYLNTR